MIVYLNYFTLIINILKKLSSLDKQISNIQSDNLSRGYMQFMVDSSLKVLVEECLQLFVLLVQQSCFLNEVLPLNQESVVLGKCFVQGSPHALLLFVEHSSHFLPEDSLLSLYPLLLLFFCFEVGALLHSRVAHQLCIVRSFLSLLVEVSQNVDYLVHVYE